MWLPEGCASALVHPQHISSGAYGSGLDAPGFPAQGSAAQAAECLEKTARTMRLLQREGGGGTLALLTGAVMGRLAAELLSLRCGLPCRAAGRRPRTLVISVRRPDPPRGPLQAGRVPARARAEAGQRVSAVHRLRGARARAGRLGRGGGRGALAVTGWAWAVLPGLPGETAATGGPRALAALLPFLAVYLCSAYALATPCTTSLCTCSLKCLLMSRKTLRASQRHLQEAPLITCASDVCGPEWQHD
jgi:hypothetical protein